MSLKNALTVSLSIGLALSFAGGCDKSAPKNTKEQAQTTEDSPAKPSSSAEEAIGRAGGGFTWRDALDGTPDEAQAALGNFDDCEPNARLPGLGPSNRQLWLRGIPFCRFKNEPQKPNTKYKITGILYSKGDPTMVELEPRSETEVSNVVESFGLPRMEVERRGRTGRGDRSQNLLMLRPSSIEIEDDALLGVDIFTHPESPDRVETVRVASVSENWPSLISAMQVRNPSAVTSDLVMPATSSQRHVTSSGPFAGIGARSVSLALDLVVPKIDDDEAEGSRRSFPTDELMEGSWNEQLEAHYDAHAAQAKRLGQNARISSLRLAAERSLPASVLTEFMRGSAELGVERFQMLGRAVETLAAPFSAYTDVRKVDMIYSPTVSRAPVRSRTRFTLHITREGIDVFTRGKRIPVQGECPANGPTVCLADDDVDVTAQFEKAQAKQLAGDFDAAGSHVREALTAQNWALLYRVAVLTDGMSNHNGIVFVAPGDGVYVSEVVRALDVVGYKRGRGPACRDEFQDSDELFKFEICTGRGRGRPRPSTLFPHVVVTDSP